MARALAIGLPDVVAEPKVAMAYALRDDIPGEERDSRKSGQGFVTKRGHDRHGMAWAESAVARDWSGLPTWRLRSDRPPRETFAGAYATCVGGR